MNVYMQAIAEQSKATYTCCNL